MKTVVVWVLYIALVQYDGGGNTVIDNISSRENCLALARIIREQNPASHWETRTTCIAVRKAVTD